MKRTCTYLVAHQMMEQELIESSGRGAAKRYCMACERRARKVQKMA